MTETAGSKFIPVILLLALFGTASTVFAESPVPVLSEKLPDDPPLDLKYDPPAELEASIFPDLHVPGNTPSDCGRRITASLSTTGLWEGFQPDTDASGDTPIPLAPDSPAAHKSSRGQSDLWSGGPFPCAQGGTLPPRVHRPIPVRMVPRSPAPVPSAPDLGLRSRNNPFQVVAIDPTLRVTDESCVACSWMVLRSPAQEWEADHMQKDVRSNTKSGGRLAIQAGLLGAMLLAGQAGPGDAGMMFTRRSTFLAENLVATAVLRHWQKPIPPHSDYLVMDGHTHTHASHDSAVDIREKLIAADRAGYDVIAITDHNSIWAAREAVRILPELKDQGLVKPGFQVVVGEEIRTQGGYILAYFLEKEIVDGMTLEETIRAVHRQGGVAVLAHPVDNKEPHPGDDWIESSELDGVEAGSGRPEKPYDFYELYNRRNEFPGKSKLFGGDSHVTEQTPMLFGYTVVETTDNSPEGVRRALREGRAHVEYTGISNAYARFVRQPVIGPVYRAFAEYDHLKDRIGGLLARVLFADHVVIWTRWDTALYQAINLIDLPFMFDGGENTEDRFWNSGGDRITAYYGPVGITYKPAEPFVGFEFVKQF
jgi:hypothetical protein